jgi:hypothetical protein
MQRHFALVILCFTIPFTLTGQVKKHFTVEDHSDCKTVHLKLRANNGTCILKPSDNAEMLTMFSNQDHNAYTHQFKKEIKENRCEIFLAIEEPGKGGFSQTLSTQFFGAEKTGSETFWKVYLSQHKAYQLSLHYGLGQATLDLSNLAIKNFRLLSGSSSVQVGYPSGMENQLPMDTFYVKVDVGSVQVNNLSLSRARHVIADVGFGNITLDLSDKPRTPQTVHGSVAAGNLIILLPDEHTPVLVKIKDSWLCSVKMARALRKIDEGTYATPAYSPDAPNPLVFNLDVSVGSIVFREKKAN